MHNNTKCLVIHSIHSTSTTVHTSLPTNILPKSQTFTYKNVHNNIDNQWQLTTPKVTTTQAVRGDQQPPIDDDLHEDDPEFYPLGHIDYRYHVIKNPLYHTAGRGLMFELHYCPLKNNIFSNPPPTIGFMLNKTIKVRHITWLVRQIYPSVTKLWVFYFSICD